MPITLPDYLLVDQAVIALAEDVGERSPVPVAAGRNRLDFQPDPLALEQAGRELAGLLAEILDGLAGTFGLGRVNADWGVPGRVVARNSPLGDTARK